jgi:prepilin-type N-terminal cleavage/methylation domain-containing protein
MSTNLQYQPTGMKSERGFTLVEMAIVLVIIGLIIGSVFVGQNLIKTAETRAIIASIDKLTIANALFKDKFSAIAGDYAKASLYLGANAQNGDGNGFLSATANYVPPKADDSVNAVYNVAYNTTTATNYVGEKNKFNELLGYFHHLTLAGFVDGKYDGSAGVVLDKNFPILKNGIAGVMAYGAFADLTHYYHLGLAPTDSTPGTINVKNTITADTAYSMDVKMDDGNPFSGNVLARGGSVLEDYVVQTPAPGGIEDAKAKGEREAKNAMLSKSKPSVGTLGDATSCVVQNTDSTAVSGSEYTYNAKNTAAVTCQLRIKGGF